MWQPMQDNEQNKTTQENLSGSNPGESELTSSAKTSVPRARVVAPPSNVGRPKGMPELRAVSMVSERDLRVLAWVAEQYAAQMDHVQALMGIKTKSFAFKLVRRLREAGLVESRQLLARQAAWLIPTRRGLRACGLPYAPWTLTLGKVAHVRATCDVRMHVEANSADIEWICERQLSLERSRRRRHLPDGVAILAGRRAAIEVELTTKNYARTKAILDELTQNYDGIVYFCAPPAHRHLTRLQTSEPGRWPMLAVRELPPSVGGKWS
jgi:transposase